MNSLRNLLKSSFRSLEHHASTQVATFIVLAGCFMMIVLGTTLALNFEKLFSLWGTSPKITVFLKDEFEKNQASELKAKLSALENVQEVEYISRDQSRSEFSVHLGQLAPELVEDVDFKDVFPASFSLTMSRNMGIDELKAFRAQLIEDPKIEDISYGGQWLEIFSGISKSLRRIGLGLLILLFSGTVLIVGNSIKSSLMERIEEIEVLELVGATPRMIRVPFLFEGTMMGFWGMAVGIAASYLMIETIGGIFLKDLAQMRLFAHIEQLNVTQVFCLLLCGAALGFFSAYIHLRKLNTGFAANDRLEKLR